MRKIADKALAVLAGAFLVPLFSLSIVTSLTSCASPAASSGRSLQIRPRSNELSHDLSSREVLSLPEALNTAFLRVGGIPNGTDLTVEPEITAFAAPSPRHERSQFPAPPSVSFSPGSMAATVRWYDASMRKLEEAQFEQTIAPRPGEVSPEPAIERAVTDLAAQIRDATLRRFYSQTRSAAP
ncbi:MAG: hypothetical protein JO317_09335 [Verrucomicrobiae bacterium]|nr:hypothetical protein [Verrucomicrobiae bacterium]